MQREGLFREIKAHAAYEKPSERRVREKAEAIRRAKKLARKKAQREGLLPMPKPKPRPVGRPNPFASVPTLATVKGLTPQAPGQRVIATYVHSS